MSGLSPPTGRGRVVGELLFTLGAAVLIGLGAAVGRLSITQQQRIVRIRQEKHRWLLHAWQRELEHREGRCDRCRTR